MKKHTLNIALVVLALCGSVGSQAASTDMYIKLEGVDGGSAEENKSGESATDKTQPKSLKRAGGQQKKHGPVLKVKPKGVQAKPKAKARIKPAPSRGIEPDEIDSK